MTVTVYKSTDASAPTLSGTAGDLTTLLDAILVNGYGSKASQGYTIAFTGTNRRDYKCGAGNQRYLDVDDTGTGSASYARVVGYEAMTALGTGTGPFPTAAQLAGGAYMHKSSVASSTTRPWFCYGNGTMFHLFVDSASSGANPVWGMMSFGDFTSYVASDTFNTILIAANVTTVAPSASNNHQLCVGQYAFALTLAGHWICRSYSGVGGSVGASKFSNASILGLISGSTAPFPFGSVTGLSGTGAGGTTLPYPNAADSGLYCERVWLSETSTIRGELPGMWAPMHVIPIGHLDTFTGASGALSGKSFESLKISAASSNGEVFMETSSTW